MGRHDDGRVVSWSVTQNCEEGERVGEGRRIPPRLG